MNANPSRPRSGLVAAAIVLAFFILWEGGVALSHMPPYLLPAPSQVVQTLLANSALYANAFLITIGEALVGLAWAWRLAH
jgi:NitT/TauT family transport system permease protein